MGLILFVSAFSPVFLPSVGPLGGSQRVLVGDDSTAVPDSPWTELCQRGLVSLCLTFSPEWREARGGGGGEFLGGGRKCCDFS